MSMQAMPTKFAPAPRAAQDLLWADAARFRQDQFAVELLAAAPGFYFILNEQRQIVFASETVLALPGVTSIDDVIGLRPGEALDCIHADDEPGGCGTSEFCHECGAVRAILTSLSGRRDVQECRLTLKNGEALDLQVSARPFHLDGRPYSLFTVLDIASEKRRRVLERIFFHDILNTAGGMMGLAELLRDGTPEDFEEYKDIIYMLSHSLVDEIKAQQILAAAEAGELSLELTRFNALHVVYELLGAYTQHEVGQGRNLAVAADAEAVSLVSDKTLVRRVVGNMVKNAFEASHAGQTVTLNCRNLGDAVEFSVHNPNEMPRNVQLQIFQRSFSTKGAGRGLGTYSMKLLSEHYLHGQVAFSSSAAAGTTFYVRYPREFPTQADAPTA
ncbi:MAG TPA: GHKL domain-containing protein [Chloroflexi bacterium]|nr:GHKL domain-containing protein [Chloroflexota bacterium]